MYREICAVFLLCGIKVLAYHDPDLNYHLNQLQVLKNCDDKGYNYPIPAVQLSTTGIKVANPVVNQPLRAPIYNYLQTVGQSSNIAYQPAPISQNTGYLPPPAITYVQQLGLSSPTAFTKQRESHGYTTSAGLSSYTGQRTVTPLATYAQAPIIAKITAAPLIAKYAATPAKFSYSTQNLISSQGGINSASYDTENLGNPVVSQVFAAPSARYVASPALKVQASQANIQASQVGSVFGQYGVPSITQGVGYVGASIPQTLPPVVQYTLPVAQGQVRSPAVAQYTSSVSHGGGANYYTPSSGHLVGAVPQVIPQVQHSPSVITKNVHTDFLENYDAHPRYSYEYRVHDPHTGDIKHQQEQRDGEVVKGQYSLVEPDGSVRTVDYVADWETGFHANVRNSKQTH